MERGDREYRDEPQAEESKIVRNLVEPNQGEVDRLYATPRTRSRSSFPANDDGLDGDKCIVVVSGDTWKCEKVRGKWFRLRMSNTVQQDAAEETAEGVVDKAIRDYDKSLPETETGIEEAPIDGEQYARKDADWEQVAATGGSIPPDVDIDCGNWDLGTDCDIDCGRWD